LYYDPNDGKKWSEGDIFDLKNALQRGTPVDEVAEFLCRSGTSREAVQKAIELGLDFKLRSETKEEPKMYRGSTTLRLPSKRGERPTRAGYRVWKGRWLFSETLQVREHTGPAVGSIHLFLSSWAPRRRSIADFAQCGSCTLSGQLR
jgi:hypothetical protein